MHWIALVESPDHVCCRYRLRAYEPWFAAAGISMTYAPLPRSFFARQRLFASLQGANVILQRRLLDGWSWKTLRRNAARIAFDFDDAVWLRDSYAGRGLTSWRRARRFRRTVRGADVILAGNSVLAAAAERHVHAERVRVMPTCVNPDNYRTATHKDRNCIRLVWIGSSSTMHGLERIADLLNLIGSRLPGVSLRVICDRTIALDRLPVEFVPWTGEAEAEALAGADIGIAWQPDDDWSRGKCGLKVLQYMAAGLPVIANPVGVHREMIHAGRNGYLAETPTEWIRAISLLTQPELRRRFGRFGRDMVERQYSTDALARHWIRALTGFQTRTTLAAIA